MQPADIGSEVRDFIVNNFLFGKADGLSDDDSLLENGVIDSTGVLELVNFVEERFGIRIEDDEVIPANLDSVHNLQNYIGGKASSSTREG